MCGFSGFIGSIGEKERVLSAMMDTIIHRGPDSEGMFIDEQAALGFRRLSIIDISETGDQPLYNEDRSMVLTFNGEIYNYQELRKELMEAGHEFKSDSDSETLLHGYEEWGTAMLQRLRGMYAFVIWDTKTKKLFGARDIFGIKPFYYAKMKDTLMFGSEIKSFLPHPDFVKELNEEALGNYLSFQFVPSEETFFKGVFCLKPGSFFIYDGENLDVQEYFEPHFEESHDKSYEETVDAIQKVLGDTVEAHKIADVEVASYLSGGVDSSYLAYMGNVDHTFTVGFAPERYSEIGKAKEFAEFIKTENDAKVITPDEYFESLSDIMYYMDEPVADPAAIALYFLSQEAAKKVKVVLSGEGADELFGGYNIYCEPLEHTGFDKIPMCIRKVLAAFAEVCLPRGVKGRGFLMRHGKTLEERYYCNATNIFTEREANSILKNGCKPGIQKITAPLYAKVKDKDPVTKMQYVDMHLWLVHDILMKGDKMGMANSVEVRVPFLDKNVLELAETLPLEYKVRPPKTKVAFREAAVRGIPSKTATRKKLGFPVPIRKWLKEEKYYRLVKDAFTSEAAEKYFDTKKLNKMLDEFKNKKTRNEKTDNSRKIWTVYVFLLWYQRFFEAAN
ncbi:MAG: asparagine synthase (glutamine-hydrolyzing) [Hespellia sp.]|nr:asparagine synthase (glutamine-hydrolyzing) [Hespellia sp.]